MPDITREELAEMKRRCEAAAKGPWDAKHHEYGDEIWYGGRGCGMWQIEGPDTCFLAANDDLPDKEICAANAQFIAHARTDLPRLIAAHEELLEKPSLEDLMIAGYDFGANSHREICVWKDSEPKMEEYRHSILLNVLEHAREHYREHRK